jgi:energy-coupling factor transporter transmembrane protein EcfT
MLDQSTNNMNLFQCKVSYNRVYLKFVSPSFSLSHSQAPSGAVHRSPACHLVIVSFAAIILENFQIYVLLVLAIILVKFPDLISRNDILNQWSSELVFFLFFDTVNWSFYLFNFKDFFFKVSIISDFLNNGSRAQS